jgi:hypothetical protein
MGTRRMSLEWVPYQGLGTPLFSAPPSAMAMSSATLKGAGTGEPLAALKVEEAVRQQAAADIVQTSAAPGVPGEQKIPVRVAPEPEFSVPSRPPTDLHPGVPRIEEPLPKAEEPPPPPKQPDQPPEQAIPTPMDENP